MKLLSTGLLDWQGWFLLTLLVAVFVQRATYAYCAAQWLRLAPAKARDVVLAARREAARAVREQRQLEAEAAELRGRLAAVEVAVSGIEPEETEPLQLVARRKR